MKTQEKPMTAPDLIQCLAGELLTLPFILVEAIKQDEQALKVVRQYGRGEADYRQVLDVVSNLI
jgi:hypothetical protein